MLHRPLRAAGTHQLAGQVWQSATVPDPTMARILQGAFTLLESRIARLSPCATTSSLPSRTTGMGGRRRSMPIRVLQTVLVPFTMAFALACTMAGTNAIEPLDRQFIDMMVPHHQAAVEMAKIALERGEYP